MAQIIAVFHQVDLDQDTNQWVADIEYNGQVKAYYAGQHFGKWVVRNITANGVKVR